MPPRPPAPLCPRGATAQPGNLPRSLPRRSTLLALLASATIGSCSTGTGAVHETGWWTEECPETPTCTLHACATQGLGTEDGVACCIAAEGRGLDEQAAAELAVDCNPATMSCDPDDYLGEPAALCIAQVAGLSAGGGSCGGHLWVDGEAGTAWWIVENQDPSDCSTGLCVQVDAVSGAPEGSCAWAD